MAKNKHIPGHNDAPPVYCEDMAEGQYSPEFSYDLMSEVIETYDSNFFTNLHYLATQGYVLKIRPVIPAQGESLRLDIRATIPGHTCGLAISLPIDLVGDMVFSGDEAVNTWINTATEKIVESIKKRGK